MYEDILAQYDDAFAAAKVKDGSIPDGKYQVRVDRASIEEKDGRINLVWEFEILVGENAGMHVFKRSQLNNKERFDWLKTDLYKCGIELHRLSEIECALGELLDKTLEINLKTSEPYKDRNGKERTSQNCWIVKELDININSFGNDVFPEEEIPF